MSYLQPILFVLGVNVACVGLTAAVSLDGLVANSPFEPKKVAGQVAVVTQNTQLEFRGVIAMPEGVFFGIYDRSNNTSAWVVKDDDKSEFRVVSYDEVNDLLTVDYMGQKHTLSLLASKIDLATPSSVQTISQPPGAPYAGAAPKLKTPEEQRRLEAVAAEVRRRRAIRVAAPVAPAAPAETRAQAVGP